MKYSDIVGQKHIKEHFQSAVINGTVSHAYIINGEKSSGKAMLADTFAMSIMCEAGGSEPCMECESCRKTANRSNPDIIRLKKDTNKKTDIIGIDEIRHQIISGMYERPYNGNHKVYIIDDADKMNVQAQNAILKTLEEPPSYAVLLLLTRNAKKLLPTIISRCIVLNMRPVKDSEIKQYLRERGRLTDSDLDVITAMASGNVGKAKLLSEDSSFREFEQSIKKILKEIPKSDLRAVLDGVDTLSAIKAEKKYSIEDIFELLTLFYRDVLLFKATGETEDLINKNDATDIALQAGYFSYEALRDVILKIEDARGKLGSNVNFESVMELLLINIQEMSK